MPHTRSAIAILVTSLTIGACAAPPPPPTPPTQGLLLALAVLGKDASGRPLPQPAELGILTSDGISWSYQAIDDPDSNVFHKALVYSPKPGEAGILTAGGSRAILKLRRPDADPELVWEADFGGKWSRMRDVEIADLDGDGLDDLAVVTHDQGVVAWVSPAGGAWTVTRLDEQPNTIVHEVEVGDLDGDGRPEIYATPSAPNKLDGSPQPGEVVRYLPTEPGGARTVVAALGDRHAKEILVDDVDGDGTDELYVVVEAVAGGEVEIRRYDADTPADAARVIAHLPDKLCRFLTAGDIDGDGTTEMVAAAHKSGLWLLRPPTDPAAEWSVTSFDRDSGGFEHAALLTDLDGNGADELYVANDQAAQVNRYVWTDGQPVRETLYTHPDGLSGFTWNITTAPVELLP